MTNEKRLLQLINDSIALGLAGKTQIAVQLSSAYLPENVLEKAKTVLKRMRAEEENDETQVEIFQTNPPVSDLKTRSVELVMDDDGPG